MIKPTARTRRQTTGAPPRFAKAAALLAGAGRSFYARGWVFGTSGNFSAVVGWHPLRLAVTGRGFDKGQLTARQIGQVDASGRPIGSRGTPSDEVALHLMLVRARNAGAVLHTHSVWSTILSEAFASQGHLGIEGFEMLKGLAGVTTHRHREWLPIVENSQDVPALAAAAQQALAKYPAAHGFLIRRHGLYTWGRDLGEAKRHVEILEFLLEVMGREYCRGSTAL